MSGHSMVSLLHVILLLYTSSLQVFLVLAVLSSALGSPVLPGLSDLSRMLEPAASLLQTAGTTAVTGGTTAVTTVPAVVTTTVPAPAPAPMMMPTILPVIFAVAVIKALILGMFHSLMTGHWVDLT